MSFTFVIDKILNSIAVCENISTGERLEMPVDSLPKAAKEGDVIRLDVDSNGESTCTIDTALSGKRLAEMTERMNALFRKNR